MPYPVKPEERFALEPEEAHTFNKFFLGFVVILGSIILSIEYADEINQTLSHTGILTASLSGILLASYLILHRN